MTPDIPMLEEGLADRFWAKVQKGSPDDCWEWQGFLTFGYGKIRVEGRTQQAHRVSYFLHSGEWPTGKCVCHSCDNRRCVNPTHLWLGSLLENNRDRHNKGRTVLWPRVSDALQAKGERHGLSKLTEGDVRHIRASDLSLKELADQLGVSSQTILAAKKGRSWRHVI